LVIKTRKNIQTLHQTTQHSLNNNNTSDDDDDNNNNNKRSQYMVMLK